MIDNRRYGADEVPCLSVRHLSKRFGAGCPYCLAPGAPFERNVCPRCGTVHAVRDVSLDVFPAEIVGVVGESGSGKSSLMKCLFFDEEATEGEVRARRRGNALFLSMFMSCHGDVAEFRRLPERNC